MADPSQSRPARSTLHPPSTSFAPATSDSESGYVRPRARRVAGRTWEGDPDPAPFSSHSTIRRDVSPSPGQTSLRSGQTATAQRPNPLGATVSRGLSDGPSAWYQGWTSVQEFASSLIGPGDTSPGPTARRDASANRTAIAPTSRARTTGDLTARGGGKRQSPLLTWGPSPPPSGQQVSGDIAAGSLAERDAALRAAKTASVLESHEGVNGGLDVAGRFKRRTSSGDLDATAYSPGRAVEDQLVYIHHIQPSDTFAGITLRYKCHADELRKANGLWSRDDVQVRKWLAVPVTGCEIKGRPWDGPAPDGGIARSTSDSWTPQSKRHDPPSPGVGTGTGTDASDPSPRLSRMASSSPRLASDCNDEPAWTHVRWVLMESFSQPVEMARVSRRALGYFPPRRKKSIHTISPLLTPRQQSFDRPRSPTGSTTGLSPPQMLGQIGGLSGPEHQSSSAPPSVRGLQESGSGGGGMPAWMRGPGGVGSLGRNVRSPGPERDYFNSWAKKHMPGLNLDSLPSMSIMGSETARFGVDAGSTEIVDGPFDEGHREGRRVVSNARQGSSLDRAAMAVETWIRGALTIRPGTPNLGHGQAAGSGGRAGGDLIELEDTHSEDDHCAEPISWGAGVPQRSFPAGGRGGRDEGSSSSIGPTENSYDTYQGRFRAKKAS